MVLKMDSESGEFQTRTGHKVAVWSGAHHRNSLGLDFLIYKMEHCTLSTLCSVHCALYILHILSLPTLPASDIPFFCPLLIRPHLLFPIVFLIYIPLFFFPLSSLFFWGAEDHKSNLVFILFGPQWRHF